MVDAMTSRRAYVLRRCFIKSIIYVLFKYYINFIHILGSLRDRQSTSLAIRNNNLAGKTLLQVYCGIGIMDSSRHYNLNSQEKKSFIACMNLYDKYL